MADLVFEHARLAEISDALEPDRPDLEPYVRLVAEFAANTVLDIGCGTGTFACVLAGRGVEVIAVDPAAASLDVARSKPAADLVRWIHGDATELPPVEVDLVTMTGNVAQVFITDEQWASTLRCCRNALRPGGHLVFETRDPARKAWLEWDRVQSLRRTIIEGVGAVETWVELLEVHQDLVTFRWTFVFDGDATVLTSDSTLRFRGYGEIIETVRQAEMTVEEVRDAPDRPGREFVFIARR
ncbi:MAG: class I SAM-dependent methyltransferase [Candidatus Dormibacterales bacterium]